MATRCPDRPERLPAGPSIENTSLMANGGSPVALTPRVALRWPYRREWLSGGPTAENGSPMALSPRVALRWPYRREWLSGGPIAESGSPVALSPRMALRWPYRREWLSGGPTAESGSPMALSPRVALRWPYRREWHSQALPLRMANRWVDCRERLPGDRTIVRSPPVTGPS